MKVLHIFLNSGCTSLLIWMPFIYFSCLIALAKTSNPVLKKSGESGHSCLVPDLSSIAFSFSPSSMMLAMGLSNMFFLCWGTFSRQPLCWQLFPSWVGQKGYVEFFYILCLLHCRFKKSCINVSSMSKQRKCLYYGFVLV